MRIVQLKEEDLWDNYEYHLKAEKYKYSVTFKIEDDFVASFRPPSRKTKGLPRSEVSAKYTQRYYKANNLPIPTSIENMYEILNHK